MKYNLLTMEECLNIVKNTEAFYMTETNVLGFNVKMFDYRLASYSDFTNNNAFEMRGLCFVEDENGVWHRNILLQKFFNHSQTIGWMPEDLDHKKIVRVQDKLDGSIISAVRFPNGVVRLKSKMSFTSDQAVLANKIYEADSMVGCKGVANVIDYCLDNNYTSIWELVSPENQIVLEYTKTELVLLQIRDNATGEYLTTLQVHNILGLIDAQVRLSDEFPDEYRDINFLLKIKAESKDAIEGFILTYEDGQMAKIKTDHYLRQHHMIGPDAFRENLLVETILEGSIDDVIAALTASPKKDAVIELDRLVVQNFNHLVIEYKRLRGEYFNKFNEDRKEFALKYSRTHELFGCVMKTLNTSFRDIEETAEKAVKTHILGRTKSLKDAKDYIESLKGAVK